MNTIVSTIIPLYHGGKYVNSLVEMCARAFSEAGIENKAEIIFINDSPDDPILLPDAKIEMKLLNNSENKGIHFSRVRGFMEAQGKYIHFFDQDDVITARFYKRQLERIGTADVCVCNCKLELSCDGKTYKYLYRNKLEYALVKCPFAYIFLDNRVISPGQCIIRKSSIPEYWTKRNMTCNGADDYYLWLLMFEEKKKFVVNKGVSFLHKYTGGNLSLKEQIMLESLKNIDELYSGSPTKRFYSLFKSKIYFLTGQRKSFAFLFRWLMAVRQFRINLFKVRVYK